jgi:hypothetical protein
MKMSIVNGPQFAAAIQKRAQTLSHELGVVAKKTALDIKRDAAQNTPVRTGNLRQGWDTRPEGKWDYIIEDAVGYAAYVEYGTWRMAGRHMLANAVHKARPLYHAAVRAAMMKACKR